MKKKNMMLSAIALGLSVMATPMLSQASLPTMVQGQALPSLAPMLEKVLPAVVAISVEGKTQSKNTHHQRFQQDIPEEFRFFFGDDFFSDRSPNRSRQFKGIGSGVIINAEKGYVLTNNHVVDNADKITVTLNDGREFSAKIVGKDEQSDVALVQLEKPKNLTAVKIADSDKLKVGDFTVAVGNPFGLGQTVTSGIVSALGRSTGSDGGTYENYIQTDAAVNRGNSGGPLLNLNGELIGINTAIISPSGGNAGIAFAIPSNMANNLVEQIIEFGEVRRGLLGIKGSELNADLAKAFNVDAQQGAFISEVLPDSAAEKAGLKAGDVIVAMNNQKITSFAELRAKIATSGSGKKITLTYLRDGKSKNVDVVLQSDEKGKSAAKKEELKTLEALEGAELTDGKKGVEIIKVTPNTPAAMYGLKTGDLIIGVNRSAVKNLDELHAELKDKSGTTALQIQRGKNVFYLLIQ